MSSKTRVANPSEIYDHHMAAFTDGDVSAMLEDYTDDSVILTNMGSFHGLEDIESLVTTYVEEFSKEGVEFEIDEQTVDGDVVFYAWHAETPDNVYDFGADTLIVRDGAIETQTSAVSVRPKR
jgi:ketosteroid isomerase-like protein